MPSLWFFPDNNSGIRIWGVRHETEIDFEDCLVERNLLDVGTGVNYNICQLGRECCGSKGAMGGNNKGDYSWDGLFRR